MSGYQLKAGHFPPFWLYGNSTIKQNLMGCQLTHLFEEQNALWAD